jgi:peptidoglycan/xylan/chitin deacetylase (PgdA/CDA1 family)
MGRSLFARDFVKHILRKAALKLIMQSLISLTFDDGLRCQFEEAVPILDRFGIPATFFLTANQDLTHESWDHRGEWWKIDWREDDIATLKKLINDGHEIGSHGLTHCEQKMRADPLAEAFKSKELIEGWLDTNVTSFCYPYYSWLQAHLADAVRNAGYEQARGGRQASYYAVRGDQPFDRFNVDCRQVSPNDKVSEWVRPGFWHVLTFHAVGGQGDGWEPIGVKQFDMLMAELAIYRDDGAVEILPFNRAVDRMESREPESEK